MDEDTPVPGLAEQEANDPQPESLLKQLAAKRNEIAGNKETFIPIPGYDHSPPLLLAKYRLLEGSELAQVGQKARDEFRRNRWDRNFYTAIDTFIRACDGIYVDSGDGNPVPLTLNGQPITGFDDSLAEALEFKDKLPDGFNHRHVVEALFSNDLAITTHAFKLNRWFSDTTSDVSEDLLAGNL